MFYGYEYFVFLSIVIDCYHMFCQAFFFTQGHLKEINRIVPIRKKNIAVIEHSLPWQLQSLWLDNVSEMFGVFCDNVIGCIQFHRQ